MSLTNSIRDYYYAHFSELPTDKQFHFVSRLSAWDQDPHAQRIIDDFRPIFVTDTILSDLEGLIKNPPAAKINAAKRRAPYFEKYPQLRGYMMALFRTRHLLFHYDIDVRPELLKLITKEELYRLSEELQADTEALSILSTYAINYIYLVELILFPRNKNQLQDFSKQVASLHSTYRDTYEDSLLMIYLFTHCIIGASNFYESGVSLDRNPEYRTMLEYIEERLMTHFTAINLDNKFEFLVCCRITDFKTSLDEQIKAEATQSVSPVGTFLIDTLNTAGQHTKTSFADSEHRNVLYIMSQTPFSQQIANE